MRVVGSRSCSGRSEEVAAASPAGRDHRERRHVEMTTATLWRYDDPSWADIDLVGYDVAALDGEIGKIDEAGEEIGARYLLVDTGPWIFGKRVMLPAGLVEQVDVAEKPVPVRPTR